MTKGEAVAAVTLSLPSNVYEALLTAAERTKLPVDEFAAHVVQTALLGRANDACQDPRSREIQKLRQRLGELLLQFDEDASEEEKRNWKRRVDHLTYLLTTPWLDPPLSAAVIEERDESPY